MDLQNEKCVMVIDENLPLGIIANTAAIMGITLGKQKPEVVGADVYDRTGNGHLGIIEFPVPILKGNVDVLKTIREKLYELEFSDLTVRTAKKATDGSFGIWMKKRRVKALMKKRMI